MQGITASARRPDLYDNDPAPCSRCLKWSASLFVHSSYPPRLEMIQPLPQLAPALARDGSGPCCPDCQSADTLHDMFHRGLLGPAGVWRCNEVRKRSSPPLADEPVGSNSPFTWSMARVAVGNCRQEQLRLPVPMGLAGLGLVPMSLPGDLRRHHQWMRANGVVWAEDEAVGVDNGDVHHPYD